MNSLKSSYLKANAFWQASQDAGNELYKHLLFKKLRYIKKNITGQFQDVIFSKAAPQVLIVMIDEDGGKWREPLSEFEILGLYDDDEAEEW